MVVWSWVGKGLHIWFFFLSFSLVNTILLSRVGFSPITIYHLYALFQLPQPLPQSPQMLSITPDFSSWYMNVSQGLGVAPFERRSVRRSALQRSQILRKRMRLETHGKAARGVARGRSPGMGFLETGSLSHLPVPESTKPVTKEGLLHHFPGSSCSSVTSSGLA